MGGAFALGGALVGCGGSGNEADQLGVAAECAATSDCQEVVVAGETVQLDCLPQFKGGYCAIQGCKSAVDCPDGSTCVAHDDGKNYCFRECTDKAECNANRSADNEANCSSSFDYASADDEKSGSKACIPPSN
jgi:fructose-specific component phosphotransferase system IIB-like protein